MRLCELKYFLEGDWVEIQGKTFCIMSINKVANDALLEDRFGSKDIWSLDTICSVSSM